MHPLAAGHNYGTLSRSCRTAAEMDEEFCPAASSPFSQPDDDSLCVNQSAPTQSEAAEAAEAAVAATTTKNTTKNNVDTNNDVYKNYVNTNKSKNKNNNSNQEKWRSGFFHHLSVNGSSLSASSFSTEQQQKNVVVVRIPESGWYGFCSCRCKHCHGSSMLEYGSTAAATTTTTNTPVKISTASSSSSSSFSSSSSSMFLCIRQPPATDQNNSTSNKNGAAADSAAIQTPNFKDPSSSCSLQNSRNVDSNDNPNDSSPENAVFVPLPLLTTALTTVINDKKNADNNRNNDRTTGKQRNEQSHNIERRRRGGGDHDCTILFGKIIFLLEGSEVSMTNLEPTKMDDDDNNTFESMGTHSDCARPCEKGGSDFICWQLVFQRRQPPPPSNARKAGDDNNYSKIDNEEPFVPNGTVLSTTTTKKPFICSLCVRSFPSVHAVTLHIQNMHPNHEKPISAAAAAARSSSSTTTSSDAFMMLHPNNELSMWKRPLTVIYQDEYMAVIDKPQGMPVQGDSQTLLRSDLLLPLATTKNSVITSTSTCQDGGVDDDTSLNPVDIPLKKPRPVHRLDAPTGGLLVIAKTRMAESKLRQAFAHRTCHKRYKAIVHGKLRIVPCAAENSSTSTTAVCEVPISGKTATTRYSVAGYFPSGTSLDGWITVVNLYPDTGRRHQLRRHLQGLGHSIWGDRRYGGIVGATVRNNNNHGSGSNTQAQPAMSITTTTTTTTTTTFCLEQSNAGPLQNENVGALLESKINDFKNWDCSDKDAAHQVDDALAVERKRIKLQTLDPTVNGNDTNNSTSVTNIRDSQENHYSRLCLWAVEITLPHPVTHETMTFQLPEDPPWLAHVLACEEQLWNNRQVAAGAVTAHQGQSLSTGQTDDETIK